MTEKKEKIKKLTDEEMSKVKPTGGKSDPMPTTSSYGDDHRPPSPGGGYD